MRRGALRCQDTVLSPHCEARTTEHAHVARARTHPMFCTHKSNSRVRPVQTMVGWVAPGRCHQVPHPLPRPKCPDCHPRLSAQAA